MKKYIVNIHLKDGVVHYGFTFWREEDKNNFIKACYLMSNYQSISEDER